MAASSKLRWLPWTGPLPAYTASELELLLQVEVKHAMLHLVRRKRIVRSRVGKRFVYLCSEKGRRRQQKLMRNERQALQDVAASLVPEVLPEELRAAIVLFFSLLDERQRRLFAGLEATKLGHGGDRKIADLLDLDPHTVAKGRRELFGGSVEARKSSKSRRWQPTSGKKNARDSRWNPFHTRGRYSW